MQGYPLPSPPLLGLRTCLPLVDGHEALVPCGTAGVLELQQWKRWDFTLRSQASLLLVVTIFFFITVSAIH